MDMNCDPLSAAMGAGSNRVARCDTPPVMRGSAARDLLSVDNDNGREGWKWQRQHHFYDGCKK